MVSNDKSHRPDVAPKISILKNRQNDQPRIGMVSLGCPKALVDSERILTRLRAEGYSISPNYAGAEAVIVNTCGFLDSAKVESLEAIGEALEENGKVIVTGCLGIEKNLIKKTHPSVLAITGPQQYEKVIDAVHQAVPAQPDPFFDLLPNPQISLTPRHYSYLKISEGCNHKCKFCIIPSMRGKLNSRPSNAILREGERLVNSGVKELLIISQDTSAYGIDIRYEIKPWNNKEVRSHIVDLTRELGTLDAWIRLHYVYPYPHVRDLIPLMADTNNNVLPYLDIPFQHAHPDVLRRMSRPAASAKTLTEIQAWRRECPDLTIRSTFIVGFPGETEEEFQTLLDWLDEAQLDRVGCFEYEDVKGARSNLLPNHVSNDEKHDRWHRFMSKAQKISQKKLQKRVGTITQVIIDEIDDKVATCRTKSDAPEIDGNFFINKNIHKLKVGDIVFANVNEASDYDLFGEVINEI